MHPLGVILVLSERAGTAVRAVVKTTFDTPCRMGTGVTSRGRLLRGFCLGLCLAACTKDTVVFGLSGSSTDGAQLGLEGTPKIGDQQTHDLLMSLSNYILRDIVHFCGHPGYLCSDYNNGMQV
jgi:hypothetical protein